MLQLPLKETANGCEVGVADDSFYERVQKAWDATWLYLSKHARDGHWTGELSTSALSTATAVSALSLCRSHDCIPASLRLTAGEAIEVGCRWLADHQNSDGGFGDTNRSHSNIATSLLVQAAWELAEFNEEAGERLAAAKLYIESVGKWDALRRRYGKDKTFVVPILTNCALAGLVNWKQVPALPFEAAWLPQSWYRLARMPVVSYAVPALVAMGQAKFHFHPPLNPAFRLMRSRAIEPTLRVLAKMQPDSGGYLEAVPLTSFVLMSLAAIGKGNLSVAQNCIRFLMDSRLSDGSWPIDTNLATWLTSSAMVALSRRSTKSISVTIQPQTPVAEATQQSASVSSSKASLSSRTVSWLLSCQHHRRHPFTGASPGGWGWTDLSGAVPDADDTPGALIALSKLDLSSPRLQRLEQQTFAAVGSGLRWLIELQNRDGGWPTFCRGWGKLPFDRSGTDLTAHALRAFNAWLPKLEFVGRASGRVPSEKRILAAMQRGKLYLARKQQADGSWLPLWFGNQDHANEDNPIYGTAKVLLAYSELSLMSDPVAQAGIDFLRLSQNSDGGWGGGASVPYKSGDNGRRQADDGSARGNLQIGSSIEETALALEALIQCGGVTMCTPTIIRGLDWLTAEIKRGNLDCSWPIGFYFAKLWYHERLYPSIFSLGALGVALQQLELTKLRTE